MLSELVGKRFNCISRAADMLCLFLGEDYMHTGLHGQPISVAEFSLHVQTQWRFRRDGAILLASGDIYAPYSDCVSGDWQFDLTGRPDAESSIFDVRCREFTDEMQPAVVDECALSDAGDISISFSNGVVFELFISTSQKEEVWRLIDYKNAVHTVCFDEEGQILRE